jgi:sensor histidine kinase YesM
MSNNKKAIIKKHLLDLVVVVIIGDFISYFFNPDFETFIRYIGWTSLYCLFIGGTLWKGNQLVSYLVHKRLDAYHQPIKTLIWHIIFAILFTVVNIFVVNYLWWILVAGNSFSFLFNEGFMILVVQFVVTIIITSIFYAASFFQSWREAAVNEERYKKESIHYQYKALKNQVNPHFLFNSLNSLTHLVYEDPEQAVKFIKQLSEVYRYVLEHKDNELVPLEEELEFVKRYVFLQQIRHDKSLIVSFDMNENSKGEVVPMSIQTLVENAIKHNEISEEKPLNIQIFAENHYVIVRNNLQRIKVIQNSEGIGLSTLKHQYERLTDKPVLRIETDKRFVFKVPIIERKAI